jgi:hypothetical protein
MYAPDPPEPGSSVSHFTNTITPHQLMEPALRPRVAIHSVGLAGPLLADIGWKVNLQGVSLLYDVMEAIARQSGIQIIFVGQPAQATLTEYFSGLPLEDGLRRLLRSRNYMLMYSGTERESRIAKAFVMLAV